MARVAKTWTVVLGLGAALAALAVTTASAQGRPRLVKDIEQRSSDRVIPDHLTAVGDILYFTDSDGEHGTELWRSDGTAAGTSMVADVNPGPMSANPAQLTALDGLVFFVADDGTHGAELWVSDGSADGTALVADIHPGPGGSSPSFLTPVGDGLVFAADDGSSGIELWATDGTPEGTHRVVDIKPGPGSSQPESLVAWNGLIYFSADDGVHGDELWVSNGTALGTSMVADLRAGSVGSAPHALLLDEGGSNLYFAATTDVDGQALWRTDGTDVVQVADVDLGGVDASNEPLRALGGAMWFRVAGGNGSQVWLTRGVPGDAKLVLDMPSSDEPSWPNRIVALNGLAYFVGFDPVGGSVLFRSDGTPHGTSIIADLNHYPCSQEFDLPLVVGDHLFFAARNGPSGGELWTSDGTKLGTHLVKDILPGPPGSQPASLTALGATLFFRAADGLHGRELWKSDGSTDGTVLVADVFPGTASALSTASLVRQGRAVLFGSIPDSAIGQVGLWRSDGSAAGTAVIGGTENLSVLGFLTRQAETRTYFVANSPQHPNALWRTDGTPGGTQLATDFAGRLSPREIATAGDAVFFFLSTINGGEEPWYSDGTPQGTRQLADIWPGPLSSDPSELTVAQGRAFFTAVAPQHGRELWTSDGTVAGTHQVKEIGPSVLDGIGGPGAGSLTAVGARVFFMASDNVHGRELWVSDGSDAGTHQVRDIWPGPSSGMPLYQAPIAFGDLLLFTANDGQNGAELWRSDGTDSGTVLVKNISPGPLSSLPSGFTQAGRYVYFAADDLETGNEPWRTDGTSAGTIRLADIDPGSDGSFPGDFVAVRDYAYFSAMRPDVGTELWVSDGSAAGTRLVDDIFPGPDSSNAHGGVDLAGRLLFIANDGIHGDELWALSCGNGVIDDPSEQCDDGRRNGRAGSCCTTLCTLRSGDLDGDGIGDRCDPSDAVLDVRHARLRADTPSAKPDGSATTDGYITLDPAHGDAFSASNGITVTIAASGGGTQSATWPAEACTSTASGVISCADRAQGATARFSPAKGDGSGKPRLLFRVRLQHRTIAGPFAGPVTVTITHGQQIDRTGSIDGCHAMAAALSCSG